MMASITDNVLKLLDARIGERDWADIGLDRQLIGAAGRWRRRLRDSANGTIRVDLKSLAAICHNLPARPEELLDDAEACEALRRLCSAVPPADVEVWGLERLPPAPRKPFSRSADGKSGELQTLDRCWQDPTVHVVAVVSPLGGVGKTYLVRYWADQMRKRRPPGVERIIAYSFADQQRGDGGQTSSDPFVNEALLWLGDPHPEQGGPWSRGARLAEKIRARPTLCVLDGMEPLLFPPGHARAGEFKHEAESLRAFLNSLAQDNRGMCVLTSRLAPAELSLYGDESSMNTARRIDLEVLPDEAGAELLRSFKIRGAWEELKEASREYGGHALALTLLGAFLRDQRGGDVKARPSLGALPREVVPDLADSGSLQARQFRRLMASYEEWYKGKPELQVLRVVSLFDRGAEAADIDAFRAAEPIPDLTDLLAALPAAAWNRTIRALRNARLLNAEGPGPAPAEGAPLDAHPLIREYFAEQLRATRPAAWQAGHRVLFGHFQAAADPQPQSLKGMAKLYRAVYHGCHAGERAWAFEVYWRRIAQGDDFVGLYRLGAFGEELAAMTGFFREPWSETAEGIDAWAAGMALGIVGFCLWATGNVRKARGPMLRCRKALEAAGDLAHAALIAGLFSETAWTLGLLDEALAEALCERGAGRAERRGGAAGPEPVGRGQDAPPPRRAGPCGRGLRRGRAHPRRPPRRRPGRPLLRPAAEPRPVRRGDRAGRGLAEAGNGKRPTRSYRPQPALSGGGPGAERPARGGARGDGPGRA